MNNIESKSFNLIFRNYSLVIIIIIRGRIFSENILYLKIKKKKILRADKVCYVCFLACDSAGYNVADQMKNANS